MYEHSCRTCTSCCRPRVPLQTTGRSFCSQTRLSTLLRQKTALSAGVLAGARGLSEASVGTGVVSRPNCYNHHHFPRRLHLLLFEASTRAELINKPTVRHPLPHLRLFWATLVVQAYSMVLSASPARKVNISFSDPSLRDPNRSSHSRLHFAGRGGGGQRRRFSVSSPKPPLMVTPSSSTNSEQRQEDGQKSRPPFTSPTQQRVRSLSSASSLGRGRTAPLRAVCLYTRAASMGAICKEE